MPHRKEADRQSNAERQDHADVHVNAPTHRNDPWLVLGQEQGEGKNRKIYAPRKHVKEEADEVAVVEVADGVPDPRAVVVEAEDDVAGYVVEVGAGRLPPAGAAILRGELPAAARVQGPRFVSLNESRRSEGLGTNAEIAGGSLRRQAGVRHDGGEVVEQDHHQQPHAHGGEDEPLRPDKEGSWGWRGVVEGSRAGAEAPSALKREEPRQPHGWRAAHRKLLSQVQTRG